MLYKDNNYMQTMNVTDTYSGLTGALVTDTATSQLKNDVDTALALKEDKITLFFGSSSTKGRISSGLPQRAEPYSSPCRYFLAFRPLIQTARRSAAPQQTPNRRSVG